MLGNKVAALRDCHTYNARIPLTAVLYILTPNGTAAEEGEFFFIQAILIL